MKKLIPASLTLALLSACGSNDSSPTASTAGLRPASGASAVLGQPLTPPLEPGYENLPDDIRPPPRRQVVIDLTSVYKPAENGKPMRFNMGQLQTPSEQFYDHVPEPFEQEKIEHQQAYDASNRERKNLNLTPLGDMGKSGRYLEAEASRMAFVLDDWRQTKNKMAFDEAMNYRRKVFKERKVSFQTASGYQMTEAQARQQWANDPEAQKALLDPNAVAMGISSYTNPQTGERTWVRFINHDPNFDVNGSLWSAWHSHPPLNFYKRSSWNGNEEINLTLNELMKHGGDPEKGDVFSLDGDKRNIPEKYKSKAPVVVYGDDRGIHLRFESKDKNLPELYNKNTIRNIRIANPAGVDYKGRPYNWRYQTIGAAWVESMWTSGSANHFNLGHVTGYPSRDPDFRATYRGVAEGIWGTSGAAIDANGDVEAKIFGKRMDLTVSNITEGRAFPGVNSFSDQLQWNSEHQRFEGAIPGNHAAFYGPNGEEIGGQYHQPAARNYMGVPGTWEDPYVHGAYGAVRVE